jgi:predicted kinase
MNGVSGSGKSWLAAKLVPALGALRVRSDLERKRIAGISRHAHGNSALGVGLYGGQATAKTYARLLECAELALRSGFSVIIDAAFLDAAQRGPFLALAGQQNRRCLILACNASHALLHQRIIDRAAKGQDPSDADLAVLEHQIATRQVPSAQEQKYVLGVDTSQLLNLSPLLAQLRAQLAPSV